MWETRLRSWSALSRKTMLWIVICIKVCTCCYVGISMRAFLFLCTFKVLDPFGIAMDGAEIGENDVARGI